MECIAATNNAHKLEEIRRILQAAGHRVQSLAEAGIAADPEETGATFAENALIKAKAVCEASGRPAIADDSGLVADALNGAPGVHSARYAGEPCDDAANRKKLLREMRDVPQEKRTGRFVSAVALVLPNGAVLEAEGSCEGEIGFAERGEGGFGYDSLFYVQGRSFAELSEQEKDACSHRGVALAAFAEKLPAFLA